MAWFRCMVRGENYLLTLSSGKPELHGFYTTRWVEAAEPNAAEALCVQMIKADPSLAHERRKGVTPMIYVEEVAELYTKPEQAPGAGFTFFAMDPE